MTTLTAPIKSATNAVSEAQGRLGAAHQRHEALAQQEGDTRGTLAKLEADRADQLKRSAATGETVSLGVTRQKIADAEAKLGELEIMRAHVHSEMQDINADIENALAAQRQAEAEQVLERAQTQRDKLNQKFREVETVHNDLAETLEQHHRLTVGPKLDWLDVARHEIHNDGLTYKDGKLRLPIVGQHRHL